jgi:hypothetical protein
METVKPRLCANPKCGKPIPEAKRADARYCCKACLDKCAAAKYRAAQSAAKPVKPPPLCDWCREPFERRVHNQKFCCEECAHERENARKRETRNREGILIGVRWNLEYDPYAAGEVAVYGASGVVDGARLPSATWGF